MTDFVKSHEEELPEVFKGVSSPKEWNETLTRMIKSRIKSMYNDDEITGGQADLISRLLAEDFGAFITDDKLDDIQLRFLMAKVASFFSIIMDVLHTQDANLDVLLKTANPEERPIFSAALRRTQIVQEYMKSIGVQVQALKDDTQPPQKVTTKTPSKIVYPTDKLNNIVWNLAAIAAGETLKRNIRTSAANGEKVATVAYAIDFDTLEKSSDINITRQLTPYDKRVYTAVANLWLAGNTVVSATQIFKNTGTKARPRQSDLEKINDSLTKMGRAHIYVDNSKEREVNKSYKEFCYDASLLPFERITAKINGVLTESAIHLFREPPLMTFAREREQVTSCSLPVLQSPISQTDTNLLIEDYLLRRIAHMKNDKRTPRKILFVTLFRKCGIDTKKQRQRTPDKIRAVLDHYKANDFIKDYARTPDGVTIKL